MIALPSGAADEFQGTAIRRWAPILGLVSVAVGGFVLAGWALELPLLEGVSPGLVTMKANTAAAFVLAGLSLLLAGPGPDRGAGPRARRRFGRAAAAGAALLGAVTLAEYVLGRDLGVDQALFRDTAAALATSEPGRMAPQTALSFVLLGSALLLLDVETRRGHRPAHFLALATAALSFVAAVGYIYSLVALYRIGSFTGMALPTCLTVAAASAGVLCARPDRGVMKILLAPGPGGILARRLFPAAFLVPVALGLLGLEGERAGLYGGEVSIGFLVASTVVVLTAVLYGTARVMEASEIRRREAEKQYRLLFEDSPHAMWVVDRETLAFLAVNDAAISQYGYSRDEFLAMRITDIRPPEEVPAVLAAIPRIEAGVDIKGVWRHRKKDGTPIDVEVATHALSFAGRPAWLTLARDVSDRVRAEEALRASEERYRLLFENNPQPVWVFDEETLKFLAVNEAACRGYGYTREEFLEMTIRDIRPPEDVPALLQRLAAEPREYQQAGVWRHRKKDGTVIEVEITSHPLLFDGREARLVLAVDVTQRRQLEEQLRQSQKMEAIGLLAGGVAHDFNNLLTAILGYADLAASRLVPDSPEFGEVEEIRKAGERASALTRQLLAFSRRQMLQPRVLNLNALTANLEKMLRRVIGEDIELTTILDPKLENVRADAGQLEQVLMNLAVNSRDAMPKGGRLTIETANVELDEAYARNHVAAGPGRYVMLAVTDTGVGMDAATRSRVFEPFFSTKEKGKGTGLGLSTVYGIVQQSGGHIGLYSEPGRGTTFKIYLPAVEEAGEREPLPAREAPPSRGSETILLVEDEESVRTLSRTILESYGYTVLEAGNAEEGLRAAGRHGGAIDLVLTDVVMPEMGGLELASRLKASRRGIRVLYMSGYTDDAVARQGLLGEGRSFLQKPFTPQALVSKVREVLDGSA